MVTMLEETPKWANRALQGITYWIGHRRMIYGQYPLGESALVAEICNIIYANLPEYLTLRCEVQYTELLGGNPHPNELTQRARADLVVAAKVKGKREGAEPKFVIEVKRGSAPPGQINSDLRRLAAVRTSNPGIRTMMFLVAEAHLPKRFVAAEGKSILGPHKIPGSVGHFRVRHTFKAAHAFSRTNHAQYACLVEVYPPKPKR